MRNIIVNPDPNRLALCEYQGRAWASAINYQDLFGRHTGLLSLLFRDAENSIGDESFSVGYCRCYSKQQGAQSSYGREKTLNETHLVQWWVIV
jgi:hypothetical protein